MLLDLLQGCSCSPSLIFFVGTWERCRTLVLCGIALAIGTACKYVPFGVFFGYGKFDRSLLTYSDIGM